MFLRLEKIWREFFQDRTQSRAGKTGGLGDFCRLRAARKFADPAG
jgi:hypothetical protein